MNIKKNFLSRIARRKNAAQAEPKEEYEIPPPATIEPCVPSATGNSEDKAPGSHQELELIVSGEPEPSGSANGVAADGGGDAPAPEALVEPITDESPDTPEPPGEAAPYEEYGLDLELLSETESKASREETESSHDDEVAASEAVDNVAEASAPEGGAPQETEPDAMDEMAQDVEESLAASITDNAPDETVLSQDAKLDEGYGEDFEALAAPVLDESADTPEREVMQESETEAVDDAVAEDEKTRTASFLQDSTDEDEPPLVDEEADSEIAECAAEAAAPEPEISKESEPAEDITEEVGDSLAAAVMQESPDEFLEPALAENGISPLVRDARGVWRPGKGFSRGELREVGLSLADASSLHIRYDKRRRNTHPVNVASLEQAKSGV